MDDDGMKKSIFARMRRMVAARQSHGRCMPRGHLNTASCSRLLRSCTCSSAARKLVRSIVEFGAGKGIGAAVDVAGEGPSPGGRGAVGRRAVRPIQCLRPVASAFVRRALSQTTQSWRLAPLAGQNVFKRWVLAVHSYVRSAVLPGDPHMVVRWGSAPPRRQNEWPAIWESVSRP